MVEGECTDARCRFTHTGLDRFRLKVCHRRWRIDTWDAPCRIVVECSNACIFGPDRLSRIPHADAIERSPVWTAAQDRLDLVDAEINCLALAMAIGLVATGDDLDRSIRICAINGERRAGGWRCEHDASIFYRPGSRQKIELYPSLTFFKPVLGDQRSPAIRAEHRCNMGVTPLAPLTFQVFSRSHIHLRRRILSACGRICLNNS